MIESWADRSTKWLGSTSSLIAHTFLFAAIFLAGILGVNWDHLLLILTTAVSLEAIYLAIFIQMSVNRTTQSLKAVEADIDEIQEDVDEIQKDVDEIQEDVEEIQEEDEQEELKQSEQHKALETIKSELVRLTQSIAKLDKLQQEEGQQQA